MGIFSGGPKIPPPIPQTKPASSTSPSAANPGADSRARLAEAFAFVGTNSAFAPARAGRRSLLAGG